VPLFRSVLRRCIFVKPNLRETAPFRTLLQSLSTIGISAPTHCHLPLGCRCFGKVQFRFVVLETRSPTGCFKVQT
jgi:hypothetical protein